jgi:glycosyltransferase involved in cell wall biosynthesis
MGDRIRVIFCTDGIFPYSIGGMQRHSRLLVEALAATGEVQLTVLHPHPGVLVFEGLEHVEEVWLPPLPGKKYYLLELRDYSKIVLAEIEKRPGDLVYSQGLSVWAGIDQVKGRLVVNPHGLEPFQGLTFMDRLITLPYRWVFRHIFRKSFRVVSLGGRLTTILQKEGKRDNVVVLPNAVLPRSLPDAILVKQRSTPLKFLFVGRFVANKGIPSLLQASELLNQLGKQSAYELHLVGGGPLFEEMKARFPLPNVSFYGFVEEDVLNAAYLENHVFIFPTLFEGMPTVVLEAMAAAMPILVTDTGATLELVGEENGIIIPKNDPVRIAAAMREMIEMDPGQFEYLSTQSLRKLARRFTWDAVAKRHLELFRRMWRSS